MDVPEFDRRLKELEVSVDRLRALYEMYFRGIEKIPPNILKKKVEREIRHLRKNQVRNTALRFRLQMLVQRYTTYLTYWQRILRGLEMGEFRRAPGGLVATKGGARPPVGAAPPAQPGAGSPEGKPRRPEPVRRFRRPTPVPAPAAEGDELLDIDIEIDLG